MIYPIYSDLVRAKTPYRNVASNMVPSEKFIQSREVHLWHMFRRNVHFPKTYLLD